MYPEHQKYFDPKNDFAFKKVFGSEANKDILMAFLNDVLDHEHIGEIVEVELLPPVLNPEFAYDKESLVDLLCQDQNGVQYIIEMQVAHTEGFIKRAQYYASRAFSKQLLRGGGYEGLKEVIFLAITDFVLFPEKEAIKSDHLILDKQTHEHDLHSLYFTFIELPKFRKGIDELEGNTEKWYYYLKHAPETVQETYEKLVSTAPILARAYEELERYSWSKEDQGKYESALKHQRDQAGVNRRQRRLGKEEGLKEGLEKGRQTREQEIARQMLSEGLSVDLISKVTGLSAMEIKGL
ncbi:MAG: Rpn family recombination-promoting nuclease/putative transposase [Roseivirga sp.]